MSTPETITSEIQKLTPSAIIELFVLDLTSLGGDTYYFHAGTNELKQNVVWQGQTYTRFPVQVTGFEFNGQGQFPRPTLRASNILSAISTIMLDMNDLLGAKLTRKRTLAKYLDAENFTGGVNASADPTAEFSEDIYYIDRKASESDDYVEFELAASVDLVGVRLPRRQIIQNICTWKYRGAECGYTGPPLFDENDNPLETASTSDGEAVVEAHRTVRTKRSRLPTNNDNLKELANEKNIACASTMLSSVIANTPVIGPLGQIDFTGFTGVAVYRTIGPVAYLNGSKVTLGATYRIGAFVSQPNVDIGFCKLETWGVDTAACSAATTTYNTARADYDNAYTDYHTAETDLDTASAALPNDDPLFSQDVCGKRLTSCKLRFGDANPLPFGGFPSAGLAR